MYCFFFLSSLAVCQNLNGATMSSKAFFLWWFSKSDHLNQNVQYRIEHYRVGKKETCEMFNGTFIWRREWEMNVAGLHDLIKKRVQFFFQTLRRSGKDVHFIVTISILKILASDNTIEWEINIALLYDIISIKL